MSGIVGTEELRHEIKFTWQGSDWYFPLMADPEEQEFGAGDIQTSTLETFSPSTIAGDPTVIANDLLAALTWSNWQSGLGTRQYAEQEGTGSLDSFRDGTLDTRFPNMALLPPLPIPFGTLPSGMPFAANTYDVQFAATGNATYPLIAWYTVVGGMGQSIVRADASGNWADISFPGMAVDGDLVNAYVRFGGYHVFATGSHGIVYSSDLVTFVQGWNPGYCTGLCLHDNKLYTFASGRLYWTLNPTASPWPNSSTDALSCAPGEDVAKIVEWKNRQATRSLFVLTKNRIVAYDDDDYWAEFFAFGDYLNGTGADLFVWAQDKAMYLALRDAGANVQVFQNQTISNISPAKKGGLQGSANFTLCRLGGGLTFLYALTTAPTATGAVGINDSTANPGVVSPVVPLWRSKGDVLAYNGRGWHRLAQGVTGAKVLGATALRDQIVWCDENGHVSTIYTPDSAVPPTQAPGPLSFAGGTYEIASAETDAALENVVKTGRYWEVQITKPDGTPGLPDGCEARLYWSVGGANEVQQGLPLTSASAFPARIPCQSSGITDARGVPWTRMSWRLTLTKDDAVALPADTPVLRSVTHYYLRSPDLIDGIQFRIDLSRRRLPEGTWRGYDARSLYDQLMTMKEAKVQPAITYGRDGRTVTIPAAEIRIAAQENAATGRGIYTITARDVGTPVSG